LFDQVCPFVYTVVLLIFVQDTFYCVEEDRVFAEEHFVGWGSEGRKIAWVSWAKVCKPREAGGLGILNIRLFNLALLGKWRRRLFYSKKD